MNLFPHQKAALEAAKGFQNVAFFHEMGLGKTITATEHMLTLGNKDIVIVCQKSLIGMWLEHLKKYKPIRTKESLLRSYAIHDMTKVMKRAADKQVNIKKSHNIFVINYDLLFRRPWFLKLKDFTLVLDESSEIKNEKTKRCKFVMKMEPTNTILLSGTPFNGKYEFLYSQLRLLGYGQPKWEFLNEYAITALKCYGGRYVWEIVGYKNIDHLKDTLKSHGAQFLKAKECVALPSETTTKLYCTPTADYRKFLKDRIITVKDNELVGDCTLSMFLYSRMLCSGYNPNKLELLKDLLSSIYDRVVIFYSFNCELEALKTVIEDRPLAIVNGQYKDLSEFKEKDNCVLLCQYKAGSMGLNLQESNKIIYFSPCVSVEYYIQSRKRINRIGQAQPCFYWELITEGTIEEKIIESLERGEDFTNELFKAYIA